MLKRNCWICLLLCFLTLIPMIAGCAKQPATTQPETTKSHAATFAATDIPGVEVGTEDFAPNMLMNQPVAKPGDVDLSHATYVGVLNSMSLADSAIEWIKNVPSHTSKILNVYGAMRVLNPSLPEATVSIASKVIKLTDVTKGTIVLLEVAKSITDYLLDPGQSPKYVYRVISNGTVYWIVQPVDNPVLPVGASNVVARTMTDQEIADALPRYTLVGTATTQPELKEQVKKGLADQAATACSFVSIAAAVYPPAKPVVTVACGGVDLYVLGSDIAQWIGFPNGLPVRVWRYTNGIGNSTYPLLLIAAVPSPAPPPPAQISVLPSSLTVKMGYAPSQFQAIITDQAGKQWDVSTSAVWSVEGSLSGTLVNGLFTPFTVGSGYVVASYAGVTSRAALTVNVANRAPVCAFGTILPLTGLKISAQIKYTDPDGDAFRRMWVEWGDGQTTDILGNQLDASGYVWVQHEYAVAATYVATAKATDTDGATGSSSPTSVIVGGVTNHLPNITVNCLSSWTVPAGSTVTFTWTTYDADGNIVQVAVDFGDGTFVWVTGNSITHVYPNAGSYIPRFTAYDGTGWSPTSTCAIDVSPAVVSLGTVNLTANITAPFSLTGPQNKTGTTPVTFTGMPAGTYVATPLDVTGYTKPAPQTLTLAANGTISFSFNYAQIFTPITFSTTSLGPYTLGVAVNDWVRATGGPSGSTLVYSVTGLPSGLTMGSDGHITGTPTALGTYTIYITVKAAGYSGTDVTRMFSITINPSCSTMPTILSPINGQAVSLKSGFRFNWTKVCDAVGGYNLYVMTAPNSSGTTVWGTAMSPAWTSVGYSGSALQPGRTYYWVLQMGNFTGAPLTSFGRFTTVP